MKRKYLRFSNKVLTAAITGLVGGLASCNYLVKYGPDPYPDVEVLYGPAPYDTVVCEYGVMMDDGETIEETPAAPAVEEAE